MRPRLIRAAARSATINACASTWRNRQTCSRLTDFATVRSIRGLVIIVKPNSRKTGMVSGYAQAMSATRAVSVNGTLPHEGAACGRRPIDLHKSNAQIANPLTSIQALAAMNGYAQVYESVRI